MVVTMQHSGNKANWNWCWHFI